MIYGIKRDGIKSIFAENYLLYKNYIGFIGLGGLSPEIQFNTRVIYSPKKLHFLFAKTDFWRTAEPIQMKFGTIIHWPKDHSGKLFS